MPPFAMAAPPGWSVGQGPALVRTFAARSFAEARAFVLAIADLAEARDHHPDLIWSFDRVTVRWTTHDVGGLSALDHDLAARSSEVAEALGLTEGAPTGARGASA